MLKVHRDLLGRLDQLALRVHKDLKVHRVHRAHRGRLVHREPQVHKAHRAQSDRKVHRAQ